MRKDLAAALERVGHAFASYPRRAVLDGCPHCAGETPVDEHDLFSLSIRLGNTVGDRDDVKSLLPVLFRSLVEADDLDPGIVLGKLAHEEWRTWPPAEQQAVDQYLDAVWLALLSDFPSRTGVFGGAADFLDAVAHTGEGIERFLTAWDATGGVAADRQLASLVNDFAFRARRQNEALAAWLCRESTRDRLLAAFERDCDSPWADELADAHDQISR
ncbi:hypothetical protein NLX83_31625 [Allokutzneria sp. A3M-2-11 16]|uniref:hypothetical protein n=1 Tax=Allokutzneria sp. A3M-2-11 16 TaxID=2962043 RepID=UPI0020B8F703|nr:hypothetical protein [Allokutzneria sp. A3M-2-11 16]MCP3803829.1 hypothetical protein [Allokutzneria sp. A3M-2-11 16]